MLLTQVSECGLISLRRGQRQVARSGKYRNEHLRLTETEGVSQLANLEFFGKDSIPSISFEHEHGRSA
jgi:hypothetical protein